MKMLRSAVTFFVAGIGLFSQWGTAHCQVPDSLTPKLRWRRPAFSEARAISMDGSKVLFLSKTEFGVWTKATHDIDQVIPIGEGNVVNAAFEPGAISVVALETNDELTRSMSGGIAHLTNSIHHLSLFHYSIRSPGRKFVSNLVALSPDLNFSEDGSRLFEFADHYLRVFDASTGEVIDSTGRPPFGYDSITIQPNNRRYPDEPEMWKPNTDKGVYPSSDGKFFVLYAGEGVLTVYQQRPLRELYSVSPLQRLGMFISAIWISPDDHVRFSTWDSLKDWDLSARQFEQISPFHFGRAVDHPVWKSLDTLVAIHIFAEQGYRRPQLYDYGDRYKSSDPQPNDSLFLIDLKHQTSHYIAPIIGLCDLMLKTSRFVIYSQQGAAFELLDLQTMHRDTLAASGYDESWLLSVNAGKSIMAHSYSRGGMVLRAVDGKGLHRYTGFGPSPANRSPDGKYECIQTWQRQVILQARSTIHVLKQWDAARGGTGMTFSPDSKWLLVPGRLETPRQPPRLNHLSPPFEEQILNVHPTCLWFNFSTNSKLIDAYGDENGLVEEWNIDSQRIGFSYHPDINAIEQYLTSQDQHWFLAITTEGRFKVWHKQDTILRSIMKLGRNPKFAMLTPNDRYVIVLCDAGVTLVDLTEDKVLGLIPEMDSAKFIQSCVLTRNGFFTGAWGGEICGWDIPAAWTRPTNDPIRPKRAYLPLRFYIPSTARVALDNGKPFPYPRTDSKLEVLDHDHNVVVKLSEGTLGTGCWHLWDWDATGQPQGRYYMRATMGGVVDEEPLELRY
jgi:hypothetical protein